MVDRTENHRHRLSVDKLTIFKRVQLGFEIHEPCIYSNTQANDEFHIHLLEALESQFLVINTAFSSFDALGLVGHQRKDECNYEKHNHEFNK